MSIPERGGQSTAAIRAAAGHLDELSRTLYAYWQHQLSAANSNKGYQRDAHLQNANRTAKDAQEAARAARAAIDEALGVWNLG